MKTIPKKWLITVGVVLLFVCTNPSPSQWKEKYPHATTYASRSANFFILSLYEYGDERYIGFLGNFLQTRVVKYANDPIISANSTDSVYVIGYTNDGLPIFKKNQK